MGHDKVVMIGWRAKNSFNKKLGAKPARWHDIDQHPIRLLYGISTRRQLISGVSRS